VKVDRVGSANSHLVSTSRKEGNFFTSNYQLSKVTPVPFIRLISQSVSESFTHPASQSTRQPVRETVSQPVSQPGSKPVVQLINYSEVTENRKRQCGGARTGFRLPALVLCCHDEETGREKDEDKK